MQQRELPWTLQDAHSAEGGLRFIQRWNYNVQFENPTRTEAGFTSTPTTMKFKFLRESNTCPGAQ